MLRFTVTAIAIAFTLGAPATARAQSNPDLDQIRKEIDELKNAYETRIQALEKRLKAAEEAAAKAQTAADRSAERAASGAAAAAAPVEAAACGAAGVVERLQSGPFADPRRPLRQLQPGSVHGAASPAFLSNADTSDALGSRGFSLGESELTVSANVDHLFFGQATFGGRRRTTASASKRPMAQTTALGHGLTIKGGRFFSAIGYQNSIHAHAWDFADPSLVQRVFLGDNYSDDGVQADLGRAAARLSSRSAARSAAA